MVAIAGVLSVPAGAAQTLFGRTVLHGMRLPGGATRASTVSCPTGYAAVSGGVSTPAQGVALLRAAPAGTRAYAFRLANAGGPARRVTVAVACRRLRTSGARIEMRQLEPKSVRVRHGVQQSAALTCPSGTAPAGSGVDIRSGGTQVTVRRLTESLRGFSFTVLNAGRGARAVVFSGNCITVVSRPGSPRARLRVKLITFRQPLDPGRRTITHRCPTGWLSLATGYSLGAPAVALEGTAAVGGGGRWSVVNSGDASTPLVLQLSCGRV